MEEFFYNCYTAIMSKKVHQNVRPSHPSVERARQVANLLDSAFTIPIINKKIGLDPLLGLLPIGGDTISAIMATYLLYVALELRLPQAVVVRMAVNIIIDLLVGAVPVVGDILDATWKSNQRNLKLLEDAYQTHGLGTHLPWQQPAKSNRHTVIDTIAERLS